ncbi:MAG: molybdopterin molybdotransferase MoeA [Thermoplasmata archaeon]
MERKIMYGFKKFYNFEFAINEFRKRLSLSEESEIVETKNSVGRYLFKDIYSNIDLPPFDRSVVDGYAVRSLDVSGASQTNPILLKIVGKIFPDTKENGIIGKDQAMEIFTGGRLPDGADCVIMAEDCSREGNDLLVYKQCYKFQNVSRKGEDFVKGDLVIRRGTKIRPFHIGALISLGIKEIEVFRKAKLGVLSTGNELVEIGNNVGTVDSTRPMIISAIEEYGLDPIDLGIVQDEIEKIKDKILEGISKCDMLIITGGTSLGEHDLVPDAVEKAINQKMIVHGISMRPARTTGFTFYGKKPILLISGFPVAAYIAFTVFFKEFIEVFYGTKIDPVPIIRGKLTMRWPNQAGVRSFVRVIVKKQGNEYMIEPLRLTGSGILSTLTKANGILVIDENSEGFEEGDYVDVILTQPPEV